jgi:NADH-quinone oxidoreductase subunit L
MIARMWPLFEQAPAAADVGAITGCATLLIAATIGLVVTDLKRVIAYSTMSQIGYMIMAVSSAAYVAGLFHLMTHAFFKALLFMAAGSLISAMAGNQNLDDMGGFRRAMPFTFGCFIVGGLALSGFPPLSGFFSKDEIISTVAARGGWHVILAALGFVGSFLTAVYTFRMIFRAFWGDEVMEARTLRETGHAYHAEQPTNPASGEIEDTDVGFPGPDHHYAEGEGSMRAAMGALAILAIIGGVVQIPGVTDVLHNFLKPTFEGSKYYESLDPSGAQTLFGLGTGIVLCIAGIALAYHLWVRKPEAPAALRARLAGPYRIFVNKWYFDEIINFLVVRPFSWFGRFGRNTFERIVINGVFVGGTTAAVRAGSAAVRAVQSGYLRYYAALLLLGLTALGLYFLVAGT